MDNNKAIQAIQNKLNALMGLRETKQFNVWQKETVLTLINIYGESDKRIKSFEGICSFYYIDMFPDAKVEAEAILKSLISDIAVFGIVKSDSKSKMEGVNVNVNQHNDQNQTTNVNINFELILDSLKYGLSGIQIEELKEILETEEKPKEKKSRFSEKLKSFGSDVASNILSNLLTNPQVYEQIGKML